MDRTPPTIEQRLFGAELSYEKSLEDLKQVVDTDVDFTDRQSVREARRNTNRLFDLYIAKAAIFYQLLREVEPAVNRTKARALLDERKTWSRSVRMITSDLNEWLLTGGASDITNNEFPYAESLPTSQSDSLADLDVAQRLGSLRVLSPVNTPSESLPHVNPHLAPPHVTTRRPPSLVPSIVPPPGTPPSPAPRSLRPHCNPSAKTFVPSHTSPTCVPPLPVTVSACAPPPVCSPLPNSESTAVFLAKERLMTKAADPFMGPGQEAFFHTWRNLLRVRMSKLYLSPEEEILAIRANTSGEAYKIVELYHSASSANPAR